MTTQPTTTRQAQAVLATAAAYQAEQEAERKRLLAAVLALWATLNMKEVIPSWTVGGIGTRIFVLLSSLMELVAADADGYIRRALNEQGIQHNGPRINPIAFTGRASDGRDLESLLAGAVAKVREAQRQGRSDAEARRRGRDFLELVVNTQVADAARAAESVSRVVSDPTDADTGKKVRLGYIRVLTPPSCGRCAVLAGRWYRWDAGFQRHPNCDCRSAPVTESIADEALINPRVYFDSLTSAEQDYYFGKANAQAIRDGADISQVVNAGKTGLATADDGRRYKVDPKQRGDLDGTIVRDGQVLRPTVWQIYRDAKGNQEVAKAMLARYGYTRPQR